MTDEHHIRWPLIWSIVTSLVIAAAAWGANGARVEWNAEQIKDLDALTRSHDRSIAAVSAQYAEIIKRLDYIDRRLDRLQKAEEER